MDQNTLIKKKLEREMAARKEAEDLLEKKSRELYDLNTDLSNLNKNLEVIITARTQELVISEERAVSASKAKSQFLANMSHEIRTPLNGIIGLLSMFRKTPMNTTQAEYLRIVENSSELLLAIINDILEFSKIEAGKVELEMREFDLKKMIEEMAEVMATQAFRKGLEFPITYDVDLPEIVTGDEVRVRQVLLNLIGNAIKFTPSGEVILKVENTASDETSTTVKFTVADSGVGIPSDRLNSIFLPFSQADLSDTRKYGGSGLGLTISKQLVESMGGNIFVKSAEAKGSEFSFEIRFKTAKKTTPLINEKNIDSVITILSKSEEVTKNLQRTLNKWNFTNRTIKNLEEGFDTDVTNTILCDWQEAKQLNLIKHAELNQAIREGRFQLIIAVPAIQKAECHESLKDLPAVTISKPIKISELQKTLFPTKSTAEKANTSDVQATKHPENFKILVAEDNLINQQVLQIMLTADGCKFEMVSNGQEAVEKMKVMSFDLILMDCQMPVLDGYDATKEIRKLTNGETVPIYALTANALRQTKEKCFEAGMTGFLTKPLKPEDLTKVLDIYRYALTA